MTWVCTTYYVTTPTSCVGENHLSEGYVVTPRTAELLEKHLQETGGKVLSDIRLILMIIETSIWNTHFLNVPVSMMLHHINLTVKVSVWHVDKMTWMCSTLSHWTGSK